MQDISLIAINDDMLQQLTQSDAAFETVHHVKIGESGELLRDVVTGTLAMMQNIPRENPWGCYLTVDAATQTLVGTCGFKHGPTPEQSVEIAYFTFPQFEGQGYGTAMAAALCKIADRAPTLRTIVAHTLPERNVLCRILEKNGLTFVGSVVDPEDGPVWRWQRSTKHS